MCLLEISLGGSLQEKEEKGQVLNVVTGDELRKEAQNPIASLISVLLQNNTNFGIQPGERTQDVLNIQPVIPVGVGKDWNLIIRWIAPIDWQPLPASPPAPEAGKYGFGDMQPSFFLSPKRTGKLIWGAGPVFQFPTATDTYLGQGKLGIGPTVVADPARPLDYWSTCEQCVVGGWFRGATRCEPDDTAVLHQLQPEEGLVSVFIWRGCVLAEAVLTRKSSSGQETQ